MQLYTSALSENTLKKNSLSQQTLVELVTAGMCKANKTIVIKWAIIYCHHTCLSHANFNAIWGSNFRVYLVKSLVKARGVGCVLHRKACYTARFSMCIKPKSMLYALGFNVY